MIPCFPQALPQSERCSSASLAAFHQCWWLFQQVWILHLSKKEFKETLFITYHPLRALCTWAASKPHQRTAGFDGGCVWALSAPGSSSSGLPGWCWSPSVRSPASQRWPGDHTPQITGLHIGTLPWVRMVCWWSSVISHLQIDHVSGKRHLWIFSSVHGREAGLLDLLFHKPCLWGKNPPLKWPFPNAD